MLYKFTVPVDSVRSFKDPNHPKIRIVHAIVNVANLPTDIPLDPDPRSPKPGGPVAKRIAESLRRDDGRFHLLNRGICISAKSCELDTKQNILKLEIPEDDFYGILDGGHTYDAITKSIKSFRSAFSGDENGQSSFFLTQQYIHLEILVGVEDYLADIAEARNYSVPLKAWTLAGYQDKFDWFLKCVGEDFSKHIRISENDPQEVGILDLIQVLTAVNPGVPSAVDSYRAAGKCLEYFIDDEDRYEFKKLKPICRDIIRLYDYIRYKWIDAYNTEDETGKRGLYGARNAARERQRNRTAMSSYYFLEPSVKTGKYPIEKGLALPVMAGFRALLEDRNGTRHWQTDPFVFYDKHGNKLVRLLMTANDNAGGNPNQVGRDVQIYSTMYSEVRRWYLEDKFAETSTPAPSQS
jgi:hypothetical protein